MHALVTYIASFCAYPTRQPLEPGVKPEEIQPVFEKYQAISAKIKNFSSSPAPAASGGGGSAADKAKLEKEKNDLKLFIKEAKVAVAGVTVWV